MRKRGTVWIIVALLLAACFSLSGCGTDDIDISDYEQMTITLTGLEEGEQAITIAELKAMDCITKKTHSTSDKIGEVRATGPLLDTVLEPYGLSQKDFSKIKIYAKDDYDITLTGSILEEKDIILAFGLDKEPLEADEQPVRIIIPESDSAYWLRMVKKIEFIQ